MPAADVEGHSRHVERDEVAARATLPEPRVVVDGLIGDHKGRITGTAGDMAGTARVRSPFPFCRNHF